MDNVQFLKTMLASKCNLMLFFKEIYKTVLHLLTRMQVNDDFMSKLATDLL